VEGGEESKLERGTAGRPGVIGSSGKRWVMTLIFFYLPYCLAKIKISNGCSELFAALFINSGNAKHWLRPNLLSRRNAASKGGESLAMEDSFFNQKIKAYASFRNVCSDITHVFP
jgi:hypothetical protein